jgi:hypothetical protein
MENPTGLDQFITGKSVAAVALLDYFIAEFQSIGEITIHPTKTMIGIANKHKRIAYVVQIGKAFIEVIFMFKRPYQNNMCFRKIPQVPGQQQFNHHFRMQSVDDINEEILYYMRLAYYNENLSDK